MGNNFWYDNSGSLANRVLLHRIENKLTMSKLVKLLNIRYHTIERIEKKEVINSETMRQTVNNFIS